MAIRRNRKRAQHAGPSRGRQSIMRKRELLLETLEDRRLLAGIPQLAGIQSNDGQLLDDGDVLNIAPRELVFSFNQAAEIDNATLGAIQILGSGQDGQFGRATASTDMVCSREDSSLNMRVHDASAATDANVTAAPMASSIATHRSTTAAAFRSRRVMRMRGEECRRRRCLLSR